jgi:methyl-accepting chemotaxis protein
MMTHNDRKHRKSFFSIKAKIALLCTCSILIAVFVTFIYLVNVSKDAITGSTEVTMQNLAASYNSSLSDAIHQISMSADFMMSSPAISAFVESGGTEDAQEVEDLAAMFLGSNTAREDISITDADGNVLYSSNSGLIGTNLSGEAYFGDMTESGLNSLGDVFISDSSGEACITFAVPLRTGMQTTGMEEGTIPADTPLPAAGSVPVSGTMPEPYSQEKPVTEFTGAIVASVKVSEFTGNLSDIEVGNYETGYAFLLDSTGKILYYPDESLIGQAFDIKEINDIVSKVQSGTVPESRIITYTYDNVAKYAGYSVNADNGWIMFVAADRAEVLASLNVVAARTLTISILVAIALSLIAYFLTGGITKSIRRITRLINKTAELDFTEDASFAGLSLRKDETGEMSRAIEKMRDALKTMILHISEVSGRITTSSDSLNSISLSVNDHASDNSATAQELSAGMEETAATTEQIYTAIEQIGNNSKDITDKAALGTKLSTDIINRAMDLKASTAKAAQKTEKIYEEARLRTNAALEQAKAVEKINILTKTIKEIASQTSLLALNASIEAARAGEAGSGFSVVASEIGILANQSAKTVAHITETVEEVYGAVQNMAKNLEQTLNFLGTNVLNDYKDFLSSSGKYTADAGDMNATMENIQKQIDMLDTNVRAISESISEINLMVSEASKGVNDVAEKNTDIVALTTRTRDMAKENTEYAAGLKEIVEKFKL